MTYTITITRNDTYELITAHEEHIVDALHTAALAIDNEHTTSVAVRNDDAEKTVRFWWALWDTDGLNP